LVYSKTSCAYEWHIVLDDGMEPSPALGDRVLAVDMGEIHPAVVADHEQALVVSCRALRACKQYGFKRRAKLSSLRDTKKRGSRRRRRIQKRMNRFKAQQKRRQKDMLHKISRAVVDHAVARGAGKIVIGDVRGVAHGVDLGKKMNQKMSGWEHGTLRRYITYKAERVGMDVVLQDEHYTSQTCPVCGHRKKPSGRIYRCGACGGVFHRDVVGAVNILSAHLHGEPGHIRPPIPKYRRPFLNGTLRSRADTPELARSSPGGDREAAELAPM
jgi:putative transposase